MIQIRTRQQKLCHNFFRIEYKKVIKYNREVKDEFYLFKHFMIRIAVGNTVFLPQKLKSPSNVGHIYLFREAKFY